MIQIWKETLLPGTQIDWKSKKPFTLTKRDIKSGERNINRMVEKGRRIPLIWEHLNVEENDPEEWKARYARNTFGWVGGARLSTVDDVTAGIASKPGTLLVRHDVHDDNDARQLHRTGFVSPKIYPGYLDSQGEEYSGLTVAHVAASPTVCQWWQAPFPKELSEKDAFYLSYTPPDDTAISEPEDESCPDSDWSFDGWMRELDDALELSATDEPTEVPAMADEKKDDAPKKDDAGKGGDGKNADLKMIIDAIKKAYPDATISDRVSNWSELAIALESQSSGGEIPDAEPEPDADNAGATEGAPGGPPMLMSTLDKDKTKQTQAKAWAKDEFKEAKQRIDTAAKAGRDPRVARKLSRRVEAMGGIEMSFTDGEPSSKKWLALSADIEAYEKSKPTFKLKADGSIDLSTTEAVPLPTPATAESESLKKTIADQEELAKRYSVK